ncbi:MAG: hypothetical protein M3348_06500 [Acidobacteriota bacterium]|nr:hypothetical protein [Acidobacteriota bacterium]
MRKLLPLALIALACAPARSQQKRPLPPVPDRTLHWEKGQPFADEVLSDGVPIRVINDGDVTIANAYFDHGDYFVMEVTVVNRSAQRFDVHPEDFLIGYRQKDGRQDYVYSLPPEKIASKIESRARWGTAFRSMLAGMATTTTQTYESGSVNAVGPGGYATGTYGGTTATTKPNAATQRRAAEANRAAAQDAEARAQSVIASSMRANTLFPQSYVAGRVYFERKKFEHGNLVMIINGTAYTFALAGVEK